MLDNHQSFESKSPAKQSADDARASNGVAQSQIATKANGGQPWPLPQ